MLLNTEKLFITVLLFLPLGAGATTVNRCQDQSGSVTFTTLSCPSGHAMTPQGINPASGMTFTPPAPASKAHATKDHKSREVVVVGQRDDGCGNILSAEQRRKAIINQQTPAGMSKREVESLLGRPDRIISRNAEVRYVYEEKKGRSRQVSFDEHGCVKGKR
ncbi:cell envelope protein SmpA [Pseudomonas sp. NPDC078416]|uniref:cell envelope protein SmpA n=1 Tax=Pseudomonas sp. NPDC078416 TaxID=3390637 RepID=UPI003CFD493A